MIDQFELYDYQVDTVQRIHAGMERGLTRILYVLATAMGKTVVMSALCDDLLMIISDLSGNGKKVLVLAHRTELIMSAYKKIKAHCGLDDYQIGAEQSNKWQAPRTASIIVASKDTIQGKRLKAMLQYFQPDVIICDEAHHSCNATYVNIFRECGVWEGKCVLIGCTATDYRGDKQLLSVRNENGIVNKVIDKDVKDAEGKIVHEGTGEERDATEDDCLYQEVVSRYDFTYGLREGYLCDLLRARVLTGKDLSKVPRSSSGEYQLKALAKTLDDPVRTKLALDAWEAAEHEHNGKRYRARDMPTMVFCASVELAHKDAQAIRDRGYTCIAVDGVTEDWTRTKAYEDFCLGKLQVLCNYGVYLEGTDLPNIGCLLMLRSTGFLGLYTQMCGRGVRVLPNILKGLKTAMQRLNAIFHSAKPFCFVIDAVDVDRRVGGLRSITNLLGLPSELDLQGVTLLEADKKIREFEEVKERVIGEHPVTYTDLVARLEWVGLLQKSKHKQADDWAVNENGFRMMKGIPVGKGYTAELLSPEAGKYQLLVKKKDHVILSRVSKPGRDFDEYLLAAAKQAQEAIGKHNVTVAKGTLQNLTVKQANCLRANGHTNQEIDAMTVWIAKDKIKGYMNKWKAQQPQPQKEEQYAWPDPKP